MEIEEDDKFLMINIATKALEQRNRHPKEISSVIMKDIMNGLDKKLGAEMRILCIACADKAIKLRDSNPKFTDRQIMQLFMGSMDELAKGIQLEDEKE